jgi:hypothetical protein
LDRKIPEAMKPWKIEIGSGNPSSKPMKSLNAAWERTWGRFSLMLESPLWPIAGSTLSRSDYRTCVPALVLIFDSLEKVLDRIVARFVPGPFGLAQVESSDPPEQLSTDLPG